MGADIVPVCISAFLCGCGTVCDCVRSRVCNGACPPLPLQGVKLLSYLYNEAQSNSSNENYPVLLSLLKSSCEPYTRLVPNPPAASPATQSTLIIKAKEASSACRLTLVLPYACFHVMVMEHHLVIHVTSHVT